MAIVSMKALLESGVHFGHRTHKWHPYMKPYIFTERNSIHIIDLQQTVKALEEAFALVRDTVADGGTVLFVGTKRQAQDTIQLEATRCGMPWVTARWLGGTLTNWRTIRQRINELDRLERMRDRGDFQRITKREALGLHRKIDRLEMLIGGIRNMIALPDLLFVVDVRREETSIHEANLLDIPVVAMVDTNCDPRNVDFIIPSNDDAIRAIKLIVGKIADAVLEGQGMRKDEEEELAQVRAEAEVVEEVELSEEELLGEATLAKLEAQRAEDEARVAVEESVDEEGEVEEVSAEEEVAVEGAAVEEPEVEQPVEEEPAAEEEEAVEGAAVEEPEAEQPVEEEPAAEEEAEEPEEQTEAEETSDEAAQSEEAAEAAVEEPEAEQPVEEETAMEEAENGVAAEDEAHVEEPEAEADEAEEAPEEKEQSNGGEADTSEAEEAPEPKDEEAESSAEDSEKDEA
jgi:small subunit ribosomal protein S2